VRLPIIAREHFVQGYPRGDIDKRPGGARAFARGADFVFQSGQPLEIRAAYRRAMGLDAEPSPEVRPPGG